MKDFNEFKELLSRDRGNQIIENRLEKVEEFKKEIEFEDSIDEYVWQQRSQTVGLILDFLEEYHKWLNE